MRNKKYNKQPLAQNCDSILVAIVVRSAQNLVNCEICKLFSV